MSTLPFSLLPFGDLHKRAGMGRTTFAPISPTNLITSPPGQEDASSKGAGPKTPLDMPAAPQTPTEQALGGKSPDDLKLEDDHQKLQAEHQKLKQQLDTAKQQALAAKGTAAPKPDAAMGKYKSMSMQMMDRHVKRVADNLKGLEAQAAGLHAQLKLACTFRVMALLEKAATITSSSGPSGAPKAG